MSDLSQFVGGANALLSFTNTGFRTIQPGDSVLLGYDGNVSAPLYKGNYPNTNTTSGNYYGRTQNDVGYQAASGKIEFPSTNSNRNFVYDLETDSFYGILEGTSAISQAYWTRYSRANGSLNNAVFSVAATGANNGAWVAGGGIINAQLPIKLYDNAGINDVWMYVGGAINTTEYALANGSTGAMIGPGGTLVSSGGGYSNAVIKVQNGYGVCATNSIAPGSLTAFSVSGTGTVVIGANQTTSALGIAAGGTGVNVDLIPLGNSGSFLLFRADVGTYGTIHVLTLVTGSLTFALNATYTLTAAQANFTMRSSSYWGQAFTTLNANNQLVLFN